jgi:hypothetical protein
VQVPAQAGLHANPFTHQVLAMVDQQLQLAGRPIQARHRQAMLAQRDAGHRQRVGRVGLALLPAGRRSAAISFGGTLSTASPAASRSDSSRRVRCRQSSTAHRRCGHRSAPGHGVEMTLRRCRQSALGQLLADIIDRDHRVDALVRIDTDRHHEFSSFGRV